MKITRLETYAVVPVAVRNVCIIFHCSRENCEAIR